MTAAEAEELRAKLAGLADEAERLAVALTSMRGLAAVAAAAWDEGFQARQAPHARAPRDRHGLRVAPQRK